MRAPRPKAPNPIRQAVSDWVSLLPSSMQDDSLWKETLVQDAPKRFTIYEPMALLPTGSFTSHSWIKVFQQCDEETCKRLWPLILEELSKGAKCRLTHLAVNEGIPLHRDGNGSENILRSPSGLRMLYGDFGPTKIHGKQPSTGDFGQLLWVSTKQNGIYQTWAPQWTMFSRGNIKEKARVLGFGNACSSEGSSGLPAAVSGSTWAVDLYAGIGYFVFSYARLGMRVLCWEINPWSVEGLRRGAVANRWSIKIVQCEDLTQPMRDIMAGGEQIVVFLEDNQQALRRVTELHSQGLNLNIQHVNCGFLPTSEPTWEQAWKLASLTSEAWLHLHENVGIQDMESRRQSIQRRYEDWSGVKGSIRTAKVEHVELVKSFAPGVWHCVFDVHITISSGT